MNATTSKTKDELLAENKTLIDSIDRKNKGNFGDIMNQIKANEQLIKEIDKTALLNKVNGKYSRLREMAKQAYDCELPTEDITTNDGSFHKTKIKKYPVIASLNYAYATWDGNRLITIRINGEKFNMYKVTYEYGKDNVYTRPATFEEFLSLNSIPVKDISIEEYNEFSAKLKALNEKLKTDIESYNSGLKSINTSLFNYYGLADQHNVNLYEYTARY